MLLTLAQSDITPRKAKIPQSSVNWAWRPVFIFQTGTRLIIRETNQAITCQVAVQMSSTSSTKLKTMSATKSKLMSNSGGKTAVRKLNTSHRFTTRNKPTLTKPLQRAQAWKPLTPSEAQNAPRGLTGQLLRALELLQAPIVDQNAQKGAMIACFWSRKKTLRTLTIL